MIDNKTTNYNLPKPNLANYQEEDVPRIAQAIDMIDQALLGVPASEAVAGKVALATAAEVRAGTNATKAITPARGVDLFRKIILADSAIFNNFNPDTMMGAFYAVFSAANVATTKTPLYELYGTVPGGGGIGYVVETIGQGINGQRYYIKQTATAITAGSRHFMRVALGQAVTPVWSKWVELPTLSYSPSVVTIIVDGDNGDDVEGNGTEAKPFKTIVRAFAVKPKIVMGWQTLIKIKAGTYEIPSRMLDTGYRIGGDLWVTTFSGVRDVEIVFADSGGSLNYGVASIRAGTYVHIQNLRITRSSTKANMGIVIEGDPFIIHNCELENFDSGIMVKFGNGKSKIVTL
jgi:hypothetical protein